MLDTRSRTTLAGLSRRRLHHSQQLVQAASCSEQVGGVNITLPTWYFVIGVSWHMSFVPLSSALEAGTHLPVHAIHSTEHGRGEHTPASTPALLPSSPSQNYCTKHPKNKFQDSPRAVGWSNVPVCYAFAPHLLLLLQLSLRARSPACTLSCAVSYDRPTAVRPYAHRFNTAHPANRNPSRGPCTLPNSPSDPPGPRTITAPVAASTRPTAVRL